jgi:5-methylcytosine-specific restriction endonuclease McrA
LSTAVPIEDIVTAYRQTGSVWKAGKLVGLAGQTVHERLRAIGHPLGGRVWAGDELAELRDLIGQAVPLGEIAYRLGRSYAGVACKANELGLRSLHRRERRLPRGAGFDKASTGKHLAALERSPLSVTRYARSVGLHVDSLVKACQQHFPDRWRAYLGTRSDLPLRNCVYCGTEFIPTSGKQRYCDRRCAADAHRDVTYYGGERRTAIGLVDGVCQCCGARPTRGLSAHHIIGRENDPLNAALIALCAGCHKAVGLLASRRSVNDPRMWESLIGLAWLRRHGAEQPSDIYVEVILETDDSGEADEPVVKALFPA